jgi:hypothetical protein
LRNLKRVSGNILLGSLKKVSIWAYSNNQHTSLIFLLAQQSQRARAPSFAKFLDHTQRSNTVSRTPLDEWSTRRRDFYMITHNTHSRQISMPPVGFEATIPAGERPQSHALDRAATVTGTAFIIPAKCTVLINTNSHTTKQRIQ